MNNTESAIKSSLLSIDNLRVSFAGKEVVHGVGFDLHPGERLALVGESGSGKTVTAMSILRLLADADVSGKVIFSGRDVLSMTPPQVRDLRGGEVAMIFQEPMTALNPLMRIGSQIAEIVELKQSLSRRQAWTEAVELLAATGIPEPAKRAEAFPHQLSGGQRQRAMIAMAIASRPRLLLADEPTTALDVTLRKQILQLLVSIQKQTGMAMILITHDLHLVRQFADRAVVMEQGYVVESGLTKNLFDKPQHPYTQKLLSSVPKRDVVELLKEEDMSLNHVLQTSDLRVTYPISLPGIKGWFKKGEFVAVKGASIQLAAGQTLGVVGESGSGKSTLAQAVLGLLPSQGLLEVAGHTWAAPAIQNNAVNQALRRKIQVVFQDPFSSLSPRMTVGEIVGEGLKVHRPEISPEQVLQKAAEILSEVGLTAERFPGLLERYPHEFSGGQRQRIAIARALILEPEILVLDEPTSALDVTIQQQILALLQKLQKERGLAYLLITHDIDVVRAMAHHVVVMKDGVILESGEVNNVLNSPQHPYTFELVQSTAY